MGRFEIVQRSVWKDREFRALSTDARLLFLWSWTNPGASICGLYSASMYDLRFALGEPPVDEARVREAFAELAEKPLVLYDEDAEVVWVVNRARYANRSPKVARAIQREVEECPASDLVRQFVERYGDTLGLKVKEA